jgi:hypothetical protein
MFIVVVIQIRLVLQSCFIHNYWTLQWYNNRLIYLLYIINKLTYSIRKLPKIPPIDTTMVAYTVKTWP